MEDEKFSITIGKLCQPYAIGFANWLLANCCITCSGGYDFQDGKSYTTEELYKLYLESL
jgi:hypothetical protein